MKNVIIVMMSLLLLFSSGAVIPLQQAHAANNEKALLRVTGDFCGGVLNCITVERQNKWHNILTEAVIPYIKLPIVGNLSGVIVAIGKEDYTDLSIDFVIDRTFKHLRIIDGKYMTKTLSDIENLKHVSVNSEIIDFTSIAKLKDLQEEALTAHFHNVKALLEAENIVEKSQLLTDAVEAFETGISSYTSSGGYDRLGQEMLALAFDTATFGSDTLLEIPKSAQFALNADLKISVKLIEEIVEDFNKALWDPSYSSAYGAELFKANALYNDKAKNEGKPTLTFEEFLQYQADLQEFADLLAQFEEMAQEAIQVADTYNRYPETAYKAEELCNFIIAHKELLTSDIIKQAERLKDPSRYYYESAQQLYILAINDSKMPEERDNQLKLALSHIEASLRYAETADKYSVLVKIYRALKMQGEMEIAREKEIALTPTIELVDNNVTAALAAKNCVLAREQLLDFNAVYDQTNDRLMRIYSKLHEAWKSGDCTITGVKEKGELQKVWSKEFVDAGANTAKPLALSDNDQLYLFLNSSKQVVFDLSTKNVQNTVSYSLNDSMAGGLQGFQSLYIDGSVLTPLQGRIVSYNEVLQEEKTLVTQGTPSQLVEKDSFVYFMTSDSVLYKVDQDLNVLQTFKFDVKGKTHVVVNREGVVYVAVDHEVYAMKSDFSGYQWEKPINVKNDRELYSIDSLKLDDELGYLYMYKQSMGGAAAYDLDGQYIGGQTYNWINDSGDVFYEQAVLPDGRVIIVYSNLIASEGRRLELIEYAPGMKYLLSKRIVPVQGNGKISLVTGVSVDPRGNIYMKISNNSFEEYIMAYHLEEDGSYSYKSSLMQDVPAVFHTNGLLFSKVQTGFEALAFPSYQEDDTTAQNNEAQKPAIERPFPTLQNGLDWDFIQRMPTPVAQTKVWSVKLSKQVELEEARNAVMIYDENFNRVAATITLSNNGKTIQVSGPKGKFASGQYYLAISNEMKSKKQQQLINSQLILFTVQ